MIRKEEEEENYMGFIKEVVTPCFTITDIFIVLFAWGITQDTSKTLIIGLVWFTIESIIRVKIRNNEINLRLKKKIEQKYEDSNNPQL